MKTKYDRMGKEEKKKVYNDFKKAKPIISKKMNRLLTIDIIGIFYSVIAFMYDFFNSKGLFNYIVDVIIFIFCLIVLLTVLKTKNNLLSKYVASNKKK